MKEETKREVESALKGTWELFEKYDVKVEALLTRYINPDEVRFPSELDSPPYIFVVTSEKELKKIAKGEECEIEKNESTLFPKTTDNLVQTILREKYPQTPSSVDYHKIRIDDPCYRLEVLAIVAKD